MLLTAYQSRKFFILLSLVRVLTEPIKPYKKQSIAILFLLIRCTNQQKRTLSYTKLACDTTDCRLFILLTPRVITRFMDRSKICGRGILLFADFMQWIEIFCRPNIAGLLPFSVEVLFFTIYHCNMRMVCPLPLNKLIETGIQKCALEVEVRMCPDNPDLYNPDLL